MAKCLNTHFTFKVDFLCLLSKISYHLTDLHVHVHALARAGGSILHVAQQGFSQSVEQWCA